MKHRNAFTSEECEEINSLFLDDQMKLKSIFNDLSEQHFYLPENPFITGPLRIKFDITYEIEQLKKLRGLK